MTHRPRLSVAGIPWHIMQRGNNRAVCFHAEDYRRYLDILAEQSRRLGCAIHAYVLMTNHVHLLLTPEKTDGAGLMMKHLGQRYAQYINRTYRRSGTLWERRFRSCINQSENYVLGNKRFEEQIARMLKQRVTRGKAGRPSEKVAGNSKKEWLL